MSPWKPGDGCVPPFGRLAWQAADRDRGKRMKRVHHRWAAWLFALQMLLAAFVVGLAILGQAARAGPPQEAAPAKVSVLWRTC